MRPRPADQYGDQLTIFATFMSLVQLSSYNRRKFRRIQVESFETGEVNSDAGRTIGYVSQTCYSVSTALFRDANFQSIAPDAARRAQVSGCCAIENQNVVQISFNRTHGASGASFRAFVARKDHDLRVSIENISGNAEHAASNALRQMQVRNTLVERML